MNNIVIAFPKKEVANSIKKNISAERLYSHGGCKIQETSALSSMNGLNMESTYADTDFQT